MLIHEGEFAYDIEQQRDPATQLLRNWKYTVFRLRPVEIAISRGEAPTRAEAEVKALEDVARFNQEHPGRAA